MGVQNDHEHYGHSLPVSKRKKKITSTTKSFDEVVLLQITGSTEL